MPTANPGHRRSRRVPAALGAAVSILLGMVCLHNAVSGAGGPFDLSGWAIAASGVWIGAGLALILLLPPPADRARSGHAVGRTAVLAVGLGVASLLGGLLLQGAPVVGPAITGAVDLTADSAVTILVVALLAGGAEEVFFRLGLRRLLTTGPARVVVTTLVYVLATAATGNPALVLMALILGMVCSLALEWTRWWPAPLIIHAARSVTMVGIFPLVAPATG